MREHVFFEEVDWENLLREKAEFFIPQLQGEEDTSYFDSECRDSQPDRACMCDVLGMAQTHFWSTRTQTPFWTSVY